MTVMAIYVAACRSTPFAAQGKRPKHRDRPAYPRTWTSCRTTAQSSLRARLGPSSRPCACSSASPGGRRPRGSCCSRPATGRPACRISAPSPRCSAPRWCGRRSHACRDLPTELYAFSDDMDGLRKVPDNIPTRRWWPQHLGQPLTAIPDPFGTHDELRRAHERPAAGVPRRVRLRLHLQERAPTATAAARSTRRC